MSRKKPVSPPPEKKYLYLTYRETRTGGESESDKPFSCRDDAYITVTFTGLGREKTPHDGFFPLAGEHEVEVPDEVYAAAEVCLVIPRYRDGDSFGTTHGNWCVWAAVTTEEEALRIAEDVNKTDNPRRSSRTPGPYRPWEGYFAHLEDVEIHSFRVGKSGHIIRH